MRNRTYRARAGAAVLGLAALATAAFAGTASAQGSAPWPQFQGGPSHSGALADGPQPPFRVRWTLPAPAGDALSPAVVAEDSAVTLGSEAVYVVDLASGEARELAPRAGGPLSSPALAEIEGATLVLYLEGPAADEGASPSPTLSPGTDATGSPTPSPDAEGEDVSSLVAVDLGTGEERWRAPLAGIARSGVAVDGETAFVGDATGTMYAVRVASGDILWTASLGGRVDTPLAVAEGAVYAIARDHDASRVTIGAFDATSGERRWPPKSLQANSTAGSAPAAGEGVVVVGAADRFVRALSLDAGEERWSSLALSLFSPSTSPALTGGSLYVVDVGGGVYRLDADDGERGWSHQLNEVVLRSSPVLSGDTLLLGLSDGRLVALETERGHLVWQSEPSAGLLGTIALAPDAVIVVKGGEEAGLVAFEHDPDGTLVDVPSPSELDLGTTLSRYALAAVIVFAVAFVPGALLRRRRGDAAPAGDAPEETEALDADPAEPDEGSEP